MKNNFINFHSHTHWSSDGIGTPEQIAKRVLELGQKYFSITEHGTMASCVDAYFAAKDYGLKYIPGLEGYITIANKEDGSPLVNHITLFSVTQNGFKNLIRLNNASHENTFARRSGSIPLMTMEMIDMYKEGLIVFTGCPASATFNPSYDFSLNYVNSLCNILGRENVSIEFMKTMDDDFYIQRPLLLAEETKLPLVFTADSHFVLKEHSEIHPIINKARKGWDYESSELYIHSLEEIKKKVITHISEKTFYDSLDHMNKIAERVEPIDIESDPILPIPDEYWGRIELLLQQALENDCLKNPQTEIIRRERYDKEYKIITESGFQKYFALLYDIISYCISDGIIFNVRGSAAGCYILYLLGISTLDPIRYNLLFERFLNIYRNDFPDVDVDIESNRREDVLKYAWETWGMRGVATFNTYSHKSLVHDLCRVLELPKDLDIAAAEGDENSPAFLELCKKSKLFERAYNEMLGQIRHRGKHAGAICSIRELPVPLERFDSDIPLIAYSESGANKTLSKIGGVKLDILGVRKLDQLRVMRELTGKTPPKNPDEYPDEIYDTICKGYLTGMFQLGSSSGIRDLTNKIQPRRFEDIALISSLYRPGALDAFDIDVLVSFKDNPRKLHPAIDKLLENSYSIMVYQEGVMDVFAEVTGSGLEGADLARRALTPKTQKVLDDPKWIAERDKLHNEFLTKGQERGYEKELLDLLWENIVTFARYGFNASHAYSYAYLTIQDAWYRTYYPEEYFTSLLQSEMIDSGKDLQQYIFEAVKAGLSIQMPNINNSNNSFTLKDKKIYFPISSIKGLGDKTLEHLLKIREEIGSFTSFSQLNTLIAPKQMNKTVRSKLYAVGAFNGIEGKPEEFGIDLEEAKNFSSYQLLGFIVPHQKIINEIDKYSGSETTQIGIVTDLVYKKTKTGKPMCRVHLAPSGGFWYFTPNDTFDKLKKGDFIRAITDSYNRVQNIIRYNIKL